MYTLLKNGKESGPFDTSQLSSMLSGGLISPSDHVWAEGMPDWASVANVLGLQASNKPAYPSVAPPPIPKKKSTGMVTVFGWVFAVLAVWLGLGLVLGMSEMSRTHTTSGDHEYATGFIIFTLFLTGIFGVGSVFCFEIRKRRKRYNSSTV